MMDKKELIAKIASAENTYLPVNNVSANSLIPANTVLVQFLRSNPAEHTLTIRPAKNIYLFQIHYRNHTPERAALNPKTARHRVIDGMQYWERTQKYAAPATITLAIPIADPNYPTDLALVRGESIATWITSGDAEITQALIQRSEVYFGKAQLKTKYVPPYDPFEL